MLSTQVPIGVEEGLKSDSSIHCDELVSLPKSILTNFLGSLSDGKVLELNQALKLALDLEQYLEKPHYSVKRSVSQHFEVFVLNVPIQKMRYSYED